MGLSDWLRRQLGTHPSKADYVVLKGASSMSWKVLLLRILSPIFSWANPGPRYSVLITEEDWKLLNVAVQLWVAHQERIRVRWPGPAFVQAQGAVSALRSVMKGTEIAGVVDMGRTTGGDFPLFLDAESLLGASLVTDWLFITLDELKKGSGAIEGWSPRFGPEEGAPFTSLESAHEAVLALKKKLQAAGESPAIKGG